MKKSNLFGTLGSHDELEKYRLPQEEFEKYNYPFVVNLEGKLLGPESRKTALGIAIKPVALFRPDTPLELLTDELTAAIGSPVSLELTDDGATASIPPKEGEPLMIYERTNDFYWGLRFMFDQFSYEDIVRFETVVGESYTGKLFIDIVFDEEPITFNYIASACAQANERPRVVGILPNGSRKAILIEPNTDPAELYKELEERNVNKVQLILGFIQPKVASKLRLVVADEEFDIEYEAVLRKLVYSGAKRVILTEGKRVLGQFEKHDLNFMESAIDYLTKGEDAMNVKIVTADGDEMEVPQYEEFILNDLIEGAEAAGLTVSFKVIQGIKTISLGRFRAIQIRGNKPYYNHDGRFTAHPILHSKLLAQAKEF